MDRPRAFTLVLAVVACVPLSNCMGRTADVLEDNPSAPGDPNEPVIDDACAAHEATLRAFADEFTATLAAQEVPTGVFGVLVGDCRFTFGVGIDREGAAIDGHTRFQIGSVSKLFAAMAASSLVEDGLLDKNAPVSTIVDVNDVAPYDAEGFAPFTLDQLLAHRAGYPGWFLDDDGTILDRASLFGAHADEPLWYPPNEAYIYNNLGYALAGHVVETAGGAPYAAIVQERIIDAIGLADTRMGTTLDPDEARSALGSSGAPAASTSYGSDDYFFRSELYEPMGGVWSSAHDMIALGEAIIDRDPRLLSSSSVDDLARSRGPSTGTTSDYAQGLLVFGDVWTHGGATSGFLTELLMVPSRGVAVTAMVGADWYFPYEHFYALLDAFAPALDWGANPATTDAAEWVGTYEDDVIVGRVVIETQGDDLVLTFPDVDLGPGVPTTTTAELLFDDMYNCAFFDWGEGELVMQRGADGARYAASRNFVARAPAR